jgi:hypothetical protein
MVRTKKCGWQNATGRDAIGRMLTLAAQVRVKKKPNLKHFKKVKAIGCRCYFFLDEKLCFPSPREAVFQLSKYLERGRYVKTRFVFLFVFLFLNWMVKIIALVFF